jgi:hypothetical protein
VADGVFRVDGVGKPLSTAAELLRRKLGVPVSYEDPRWATLEEIHSGTLDVVVPASALALDATRPADVIRQTLDSHRRFQNAGTYTLVEFGESEYSMVPSFEVEVSGREAGYRSPLDVTISFPAEDRSLVETVELIFRSIEEAERGPSTGRHPFTGQEQFAWGPVVSIGDERQLGRANSVIGANGEAARDVLARALRNPGAPKMTWNMMYSPGAERYIVWLAVLQTEVVTSTGETRLRTVRWPD